MIQLLLTLAIGAVGVLVGASADDAATPEAPSAERPNVLVVFTDDQPVGTEVATPNIARWFGAGGTTFRNAYVTTPLCCPSRTTILTGRYAHNHGVESNRPYERFDHDRTLQAELGAAGYRTGYVGKYLNGYRRAPRFDRYAVLSGYEDRPVALSSGRTGEVAQSTRFVFERAGAWAEEWAARERPWFVAVSVFAPHSPFDAEDRYASRQFPWNPPPSVDAPPEGKPGWVRRARVPAGKGARVRRDQLRTLGTVDDSFHRLIRRLDRIGELDETMVIFTSDNGMMWGQHGLTKKTHPYQESVRVPMYARGPGVPAEVSDRLVANVDIAPTIYAATGVEPEYRPDGRDMLGAQGRSRLLLEHRRSPTGGPRSTPSWRSLVTEHHQYIRYRSGEEELYDLGRDPHQLTNLAGSRNVTTWRAWLDAVRSCRGTECP